MDSSKVGTWLQVGANIGILVGLVLVILQMQQNESLLEAQLRFSYHDRNMVFETAMLGEEPAAVWAKMHSQPADLSLYEQRVAEAILYSAVDSWRSLYNLHEEGLMTDQEWKEAVRRDSSYVFNHPYGLAALEHMKDDLPSELVEVIEQDIARDGLTATGYHESIMRDAQRR